MQCCPLPAAAYPCRAFPRRLLGHVCRRKLVLSPPLISPLSVCTCLKNIHHHPDTCLPQARTRVGGCARPRCTFVWRHGLKPETPPPPPPFAPPSLALLPVAAFVTVPHCTASHLIAPHRIASHRIAPPLIALHRIAPHRTAPHRTASHRIAPHRTADRQRQRCWLERVEGDNAQEVFGRPEREGGQSWFTHARSFAWAGGGLAGGQADERTYSIRTARLPPPLPGRICARELFYTDFKVLRIVRV